MAAEAYYNDAQRLAQKDFRARVSAGQYPYLPRLDDFLPEELMSQGTDLGTVAIPLEFVTGTRSAGRTQSFSGSFMPLLPEKSEFADKWKALCAAHLEEGIRDPIKVCEYMNRYYVEEGNKRVSVLKYFGAVSIPAQVKRILPQRNGSKEVELYYEFVDFYRDSKINFFELSKPGGYARLQQLLGKAPKEPWTEEDRQTFTADYYRFRKAYDAAGGARLRTTAGDAMLACIGVYGYESLRGRSVKELAALIDKVREEIALQQEEAPIDVKLDPTEEKKEQGFLDWLLPRSAPKKLKAAFIHDKTPETSGWTYGHELGRQHAERVFEGALETTAYYDAMEDDPEAVLRRAIAEGNTVIFTTSPRLLPASLRVAVEAPEVMIFNCSLNTSHRYIRTYYARMYEVKFITGAIAGTLAGAEGVGYICDYPIFGQVAGINAFALGVQMTNPTARVYLEWSAVGGVCAATERLTGRGIRLISAQDLAKRNHPRQNNFGLSLVNPDCAQVNLAAPVWRWGAYYEALIRRIRDRSLQEEYAGSSKALNYYWGMSAGVVALECSDKLPESSRRLAAVLRNSISSGVFVPFHGAMYDQDGKPVGRGREAWDAEEIIAMDWLNENVVGALPAYGELDTMGKATVDIVGVEPSTKEKEKDE